MAILPNPQMLEMIRQQDAAKSDADRNRSNMPVLPEKDDDKQGEEPIELPAAPGEIPIPLNVADPQGWMSLLQFLHLLFSADNQQAAQ